MADEPEEECVPCKIVLAGFGIVVAVLLAFIAIDTATDGRATQALVNVARPKLATVVPLRTGTDDN